MTSFRPKQYCVLLIFFTHLKYIWFLIIDMKTKLANKWQNDKSNILHGFHESCGSPHRLRKINGFSERQIFHTSLEQILQINWKKKLTFEMNLSVTLIFFLLLHHLYPITLLHVKCVHENMQTLNGLSQIWAREKR